jgi:hypothetical protein
MTVGKAMVEPLKAIINHHLIVPDVGPIVIEGDGILPLTPPYFEPGDLRTIFIVEQSEKQLLQNLRSRGRGFNDLGAPEQESFAYASWLYGQWLAREARKLEFPVIPARPQQTLFQRLLSIVESKQSKSDSA